MDHRLPICFLLLIGLAGAAELKLGGELHYNSLEVTLQNTAGHEVRFFLKLDLKEKTDGEWKLLSSLNCSVNGSIGPLVSDSYNCSYTTPAKAGQYKIYARADIANSTYTYKDFAFAVGGSGFKEPEPAEEVVIKLLSAPEKVKTGDEFFVLVNVTSRKKADLEIYSYVYDGKTCYSFYSWKGNSGKYEFKEGDSKVINLTDSVIHDAANGTYSLKVRAREVVGESFKDYDTIIPIEVEQVAVDLFKELPEAARPKTGERQESGLPIHLLLPALGSVPLIILLFKKVL